MSKFKRTRWKPGMVFGLPLEDGSFGIAQAIDTMWENVVYIAIFSDRFDELPESTINLDPKNIVSLGATNSGAGLFCRFLSAYHGLTPWNVMHQEDYWDKYLNAGKSAPSNIIVLNMQRREKYRLEVMGIKNA